jgi:hypothetical protein
MKRIRKSVSVVVLAIAAFLPLPGCTGNGTQACGALMQAALGVGISVGTYFLIKELGGN